MIPITRLVSYGIAAGLVILAVVGADFNVFSILILQGKVFALTLLAAVIANVPVRWVALLGCSLLLGSCGFILTGYADNADLLGSVAFKVLLIASICSAISYFRTGGDKPTA